MKTSIARVLLLSFLEVLIGCGEAELADQIAEEENTKEFNELAMPEAAVQAGPTLGGCQTPGWSNWSDVTVPVKVQRCFIFCWEEIVQQPVACDVCAITPATFLAMTNHNSNGAGFLVKDAQLRKCTENGVEYHACVVSDMVIGGQVAAVQSAGKLSERTCNFEASKWTHAKYHTIQFGEQYWSEGIMTIDTKGTLDQPTPTPTASAANHCLNNYSQCYSSDDRACVSTTRADLVAKHGRLCQNSLGNCDTNCY